MKRVACILTVLAIVCLAAGQVQAYGGHYGGYHGGYGGHHGGHYGAYYGGYHGPVVVAPRVVVPAYPPARVIYPPPYRYRCYEPAPVGGFFYRGPGVSIGVGW